MINFLNTIPNDWVKDLLDDLKIYLTVIFVAIAAAAIAYAIYLGFLLSKSEDQGKRVEAKKRIFMSLAGLGIVVVLTGVMYSGFLDVKGRQTGEWNLILHSNAYYCKKCAEWQWLFGSPLTMTLNRRAPNPSGGFGETRPSNQPPDPGTAFTGPKRLQIISWTSALEHCNTPCHRKGAKEEDCTCSTCHNRPEAVIHNVGDVFIPKILRGPGLTFDQQTGRYTGGGTLLAEVDVSAGAPGYVPTFGAFTNTNESMGATGLRVNFPNTTAERGVIQLSLDFYDTTKGSMQIAVPMIIVRVVSATDRCTASKCRTPDS